MSDILIENMKMPKYCLGCPFEVSSIYGQKCCITRKFTRLNGNEDGTCKRDRAEANTEEKRMTNYEKIKSMTIDEMAEFLCHGDFDCEKCAYKDNKKGCKDEVNRYKKWLEAEEKQI